MVEYVMVSGLSNVAFNELGAIVYRFYSLLLPDEAFVKRSRAS